MKTFQGQIKAAYLSASIKLIKSSEQSGTKKQNLTHCLDMSDAGMRDNEKILCFTGALNVAAYQGVHKSWCSVHTHNVTRSQRMNVVESSCAACSRALLGHRWCVNLANNWGEQQLVERTVLISYDQLHIKEACKWLWGSRGRRVQTRKESLLQIRVG